MKLSSYIIRFDAGFAPNPFGRYCTLTCCKPTIRRNAEMGDIVIACASSQVAEGPGRLVYAMRVSEVIPYQQYWRDKRFASRKPSQRTAISRRGDNIWRQDRAGKWKVVPGACHGMRNMETDTGGINALVATEFFYFGCKPIRVPARFADMLATTQGHKNTHDRKRIESFWKWISNLDVKRGRIGNPHDFNDEGCRKQACEVEPDDVEEC